MLDDCGRFIGFAVVTRDLTDELKASELLEFQAQHDPLTGAYNRHGLTKTFNHRLPTCTNDIAIYCIDLDRFKPVNDMFGHSAGDELLKVVFKRLEILKKPADLVGRIGGDEFVVIQFDADDRSAVEAFANRIVEVLSNPVRVGDQHFVVGATVGVTSAPHRHLQLDTALRQADLALYSGKSDGKGCARFYQSQMSEQALARVQLEIELRGAVADHSFTLSYQAIVDGHSDRTVGYEALVRWKTISGKVVPPSEFIPLAEELGLMPVLGKWILETACKEAVSWPEKLVVSVNLSPMQLLQKDLYDVVVDVLAETGLPPARLELEITETAVINDLSGARSTLERLKWLGIGIALDDFGTGFSSLSLVQALPLTRIKIDRSFVADMVDNNLSAAVVHSIIALGRGCDLTVTAEGVETQSQRDQLIAGGCSNLQGFLFGRPTPNIHWTTENYYPIQFEDSSPAQPRYASIA